MIVLAGVVGAFMGFWVGLMGSRTSEHLVSHTVVGTGLGGVIAAFAAAALQNAIH